MRGEYSGLSLLFPGIHILYLRGAGLACGLELDEGAVEFG